MKQVSVYDKMTRSEREVAEFLRDKGIFWEYEKPIYLWDNNRRPRVWAPDFYLKNFGVYVEVCGSEDFDYEYRKKVYKENDYDVIFLHLYENSEKWKRHFSSYMLKFFKYRNSNFKRIIVNNGLTLV